MAGGGMEEKAEDEDLHDALPHGTILSPSFGTLSFACLSPDFSYVYYQLRLTAFYSGIHSFFESTLCMH